jgi:hypothetical protein
MSVFYTKTSLQNALEKNLLTDILIDCPTFPNFTLSVTNGRGRS